MSEENTIHRPRHLQQLRIGERPQIEIVRSHEINIRLTAAQACDDVQIEVRIGENVWRLRYLRRATHEATVFCCCSASRRRAIRSRIWE